MTAQIVNGTFPLEARKLTEEPLSMKLFGSVLPLKLAENWLL